jgi:hypothetical protein
MNTLEDSHEDAEFYPVHLPQEPDVEAARDRSAPLSSGTLEQTDLADKVSICSAAAPHCG